MTPLTPSLAGLLEQHFAAASPAESQERLGALIAGLKGAIKAGATRRSQYVALLGNLPPGSILLRPKLFILSSNRFAQGLRARVIDCDWLC